MFALGHEHPDNFISRLGPHTLVIPYQYPLYVHLAPNPRQVQRFGDWSEGDQRVIEVVGMFLALFAGYTHWLRRRFSRRSAPAFSPFSSYAPSP